MEGPPAEAPAAEPDGPAAEEAPDSLEDYTDVRRHGDRKFKPLWICVAGSTLYFYKSQHDTAPKGNVQLKGAEVPDHPAMEGTDGGLRYLLEVRRGKEDVITLRVASEHKAKSWVAALTAARTQNPQDPPAKDALAREKKGIAYRAKKGMGSKLVGSSLGKQGIKQMLDEQVKGMVKALKRLVEVDSNKAKAEFVEKAIFKILFKCFVEYDRKKVTLKQFLEMDVPLRHALRRIDRLFGIWGWTPSDEQLRKDCQKIEESFREVSHILRTLMAPFLQPKNIVLIQELFDYVGNANFIMHIWKVREDESVKDAVFDLLVAIRLYLSQDYVAE